MNANFVFDVVCIVADFGNHASCDIPVVDFRLGRNLPGNKAFVMGEHYFASYSAVFVLFQTRIENAVRNKVCKFVGVTASHRLCRVDMFNH